MPSSWALCMATKGRDSSWARGLSRGQHPKRLRPKDAGQGCAGGAPSPPCHSATTWQRSSLQTGFLSLNAADKFQNNDEIITAIKVCIKTLNCNFSNLETSLES